MREFVGGVAPGEQVQYGVVGGARQIPERGGAAEGVEPGLHVHVLGGRGGDRVLGEDVQRVGGDREGFQATGKHLFGDHGGIAHITAVLGVHASDRDLAHLVARASHALQA